MNNSGPYASPFFTNCHRIPSAHLLQTSPPLPTHLLPVPKLGSVDSTRSTAACVTATTASLVRRKVSQWGRMTCRGKYEVWASTWRGQGIQQAGATAFRTDQDNMGEGSMHLGIEAKVSQWGRMTCTGGGTRCGQAREGVKASCKLAQQHCGQIKTAWVKDQCILKSRHVRRKVSQWGRMTCKWATGMRRGQGSGAAEQHDCGGDRTSGGGVTGLQSKSTWGRDRTVKSNSQVRQGTRAMRGPGQLVLATKLQRERRSRGGCYSTHASRLISCP